MQNLRSLARRAAEKYRARAGSSGPRPFTIEDYCGAHIPQLAMLRDRSPWQHVQCARQSGKSWGLDGKMLANGITIAESLNVLLGLNSVAVRDNNWFPIVGKMRARYGIPDEWCNETRMTISLPNGSRLIWGGADDVLHIRNLLGNRLAGGLFIVDESQDQKTAILDDLLDNILPPMLTETSQVVLSGVIPDMPAGRFYRESLREGWSKHAWGRFANVHTPEARRVLDAYLKRTGLTEDHPKIQRDWFGRAVFDENARAFRYSIERNGYTGEAPQLDAFAVGIDPGARDRCAIVILGWSTKHPELGVWQVYEWVAPRNAGKTWSDVGDRLKWIERNFRPWRYYYDAGGSQMTLDLLLTDFGVVALQAAKKSDRRGQVDRMNDLLSVGMMHVRVGGELEQDLVKTSWDKDAREKGKWEWSSTNHPDVADAARYALQAYFAATGQTEDDGPKIPAEARPDPRYDPPVIDPSESDPISQMIRGRWS